MPMELCFNHRDSPSTDSDLCRDPKNSSEEQSEKQKVLELETVLKMVSAHCEQLEARLAAIEDQGKESNALAIVVDKDEEGDDLEAAGNEEEEELHDCFSDAALNSCYGYSQLVVLTKDESPAWVHVTNTLLSCFLIFVTWVALHSVRNFTQLIAEWEDDEIFAFGNRSMYTL